MIPVPQVDGRLDNGDLSACVVTRDRKLGNAVARTLVPHRFRIHDYKSVEEAMSNSTKWDLLLLDYDVDDQAKDAFLQQWAIDSEIGQTIVFSQARDKQHVVRLLQGHRLTNLIAKNGGIREDELLITIHKILTRDLFGLDKYLNRGAVRQEAHLRSSAGRSTALDEMETYFRRCSVGRRFIELARTAAEELLANAVWSAPTDESGKPRYASLHRSKTVELEEHESVTFQYACDGRQIGIAVADRFGALSDERIRVHLAHCFTMDGYQPLPGPGAGAGLGLYLTFQCVDQLVINVAQGRCTEVICLVDIRGSLRDFEARSKSFPLVHRGRKRGKKQCHVAWRDESRTVGCTCG